VDLLQIQRGASEYEYANVFSHNSRDTGLELVSFVQLMIKQIATRMKNPTLLVKNMHVIEYYFKQTVCNDPL